MGKDDVIRKNGSTVKPFNLDRIEDMIKVGEFTCKFILALFISANPNYTVSTLE